jgi:hypothetical protein
MRTYLLLTIFVVFVFPCFAQSENDFRIMQNTDGAITITGYIGSQKNVSIPEKISGLRVSAIGSNAFNAKFIESVTIPNSVTEIGSGAFAFNKLTSIIIPNSVRRIDALAFDSDLVSITIGSNVNVEGSLGLTAFFDKGFVNFYIMQKKQAGTYIKNGQIWGLQK